jgi:YcxB-like protein
MTIIGPFAVDLKAYGRAYFFHGLATIIVRFATLITAVVIGFGLVWGLPAFLGGLVAYLFIPLLLLARWRQINASLRHPLNWSITVPRIIRFDENQIVQELPGLSRSEFSWSLVVKCSEWNDFVLFFLSQTYFVVVPKKEIAPDALAEIRRLAKQKVMIPT